jgi:hypothetical protein
VAAADGPDQAERIKMAVEFLKEAGGGLSGTVTWQCAILCKSVLGCLCDPV